ncbi:hypothetical protein BJF78_22070 [Pseudonocardia sp. CNS-139]|nr:hypothetical protein BJF78_22070 [Pseudonocardia sp. CNS-139]
MPGSEPLFDAVADRYDEDEHHGTIAELLVAGLPRGPHDLVVDVATGTGTVAFAALRALDGTRVLAVDVSPRMLDRARAKAVAADPDGRVEWRVGDALPLPLPDGAADVVLCGSALHFLGPAALPDWRRVLRAGGHVAFSIPMAADFHPSPQFRAALPAGLPVPADAAAAADLARQAGFADVRVAVTPPESDERPRRTFVVHARVA